MTGMQAKSSSLVIGCTKGTFFATTSGCYRHQHPGKGSYSCSGSAPAAGLSRNDQYEALPGPAAL